MTDGARPEARQGNAHRADSRLVVDAVDMGWDERRLEGREGHGSTGPRTRAAWQVGHCLSVTMLHSTVQYGAYYRVVRFGIM